MVLSEPPPSVSIWHVSNGTPTEPESRPRGPQAKRKQERSSKVVYLGDGGAARWPLWLECRKQGAEWGMRGKWKLVGGGDHEGLWLLFQGSYGDIACFHHKQWTCLAFKTLLLAALKIDSRREAGRPISKDGRPPSARWWQLRSAVTVVGRGPESRYILKIVSYLWLGCDICMWERSQRCPTWHRRLGCYLLGRSKQQAEC